MIETIIAFFSANKAAVGAVISIGEAIVVLINLWSKFRGNKGGEVEFMSSSPSTFKAFLWILNPLNVFRKPK